MPNPYLFAPGNMLNTIADVNSWLRNNLSGIGKTTWKAGELELPDECFSARESHSNEQIKLIYTKRTLDRDTNKPVLLTPQRHILLPINEHNLALEVRALMIDLAVHEIDESIKVNGSRIFDPHDNTKKIKRCILVDGRVEVEY